ncbi:hypothetical protein [Halorientalis salina]|uniref:hypothetical protein n=1 Tax=Halorientalis salina TaxID=2932266 RepID=UPI0010ACBD72|nr:hypothetical protein [Halorientalis salina]
MTRRRTVLRTGSALVALGFAGCNALSSESDSEDDGEDPDADEEETTSAGPRTTDSADGPFENGSTETEQRGGEGALSRFQVVQAIGRKTDADGDTAIGAVELVVTKAQGTGDIDLSNVTIQWVDETDQETIVYERVDGGDSGSFAYEALEDEDGSLADGDAPVINSEADRARLVIDIGAAESGNAISEAYSTPVTDETTIKQHGLGEGEMASLQLVTAAGVATTIRLTVPDSLDGTEVVQF